MRPGPDAPVALKKEDHLQRWRFARGPYDLIKTSPPEWSLRIGVYGRWGEGKTTVLRFLETMAREDKYPVAWFNPWATENRAAMWEALASCIEGAIGKSTVTGPRLKKAGNNLLKALGAAADEHWLGKALKSLAGTTLEQITTIGRSDLEQALAEALGSGRLLVMIDDIDRADPGLLPYLLLSLREILDLPQCAFILALDPETVSKALKNIHAGWGSGLEFLEKIIDFPQWLPETKPADLWSLVQAELPSLRGFVDEAALRDIADLLPTNPRRLKQFLRLLWLIRPIAARHDADELSWTSLLICQLLEMEVRGIAQAIVCLRVLANEIVLGRYRRGSQGGSSGSEGKRDQEFAEELEKLFGRMAITEKGKQDRIKGLIEAWRDRCSFFTVEQLGYHARLSEEPPIMTWKEFHALFGQWRNDPTIARTQALIRAHAAQVETSDRAVLADLFATLIVFRKQKLGQAADSVDDEELLRFMDEADAALMFLRMLALDLGGFTGESPHLDAHVFEQLFEMVRHWIHFRNHQRYHAARKAEEALLVDIARQGRTLAGPLIGVLRPWDPEFMIRGWASHLLGPLLIQIEEPLLEHVADDLLERFSRPDGIRGLYGQSRHNKEVFEMDSPKAYFGQEVVEFGSRL